MLRLWYVKDINSDNEIASRSVLYNLQTCWKSLSMINIEWWNISEVSIKLLYLYIFLPLSSNFIRFVFYIPCPISEVFRGILFAIIYWERASFRGWINHMRVFVVFLIPFPSSTTTSLTLSTREAIIDIILSATTKNKRVTSGTSKWAKIRI